MEYFDTSVNIWCIRKDQNHMISWFQDNSIHSVHEKLPLSRRSGHLFIGNLATTNANSMQQIFDLITASHNWKPHPSNIYFMDK